MADLKTNWVPGDSGLSGAVNAAAAKVNALDALTATGRLSEAELSASIAAVAAGPMVSDTIRNTLLDGLRLVRVTQAEYDALPTPRPVDVLYVVTN